VLFVTGMSTAVGSGEFNYATVAYRASTGRQSWASRYTRLSSLACCVAVSPGERAVFVTGGSGNYNYGTIAYRA